MDGEHQKKEMISKLLNQCSKKKADNAPLPTLKYFWDEMQTTSPHKLTCQVPAHLLNEGNYTVKLLLVEEGTRASVILDEVIGFDVKDLIQREVGSWHGREPGPVRPSLQWKLQ